MGTKFLWAFILVGSLGPLLSGNDGAMLFESTGYSGAYLAIEGDIPNLRHTDWGMDRSGSIRIPSGYKVILYEDPDFTGTSISLRYDVPDLTYTRLGINRLASVRLIYLGEYWPDLPGDTTVGITLFSGTDFQGDYEIFQGDVPNFRASHIGNDQAVSVLVPPGFGVTLYEHENFGGYACTLNRSVEDLGLTPMGRRRVSSLRVFQDAYYPMPAGMVQGPEWDWAPRVGVDIHIGDDDAEDVIALAAGILLTAAIIKTVKEKRRKVTGPGITLYDGKGFTGRRENFHRGVRKMKKTWLGEDRVSSIEIPPGYEVILYRHGRYRGKRVVLRKSVADLGLTSVGDNQVSSMRLYQIQDPHPFPEEN